MKKENNLPKLVIAGPGSGKTTDMVEEIMSVLPLLKPTRMLATITFTNSATEKIRSRLSQKVHIPNNVFIGTNDRFFNQFILIPYATVFDQVGLDKLFFELDVNQLAMSQSRKGASPAEIAQKRNGIANAYIKSGKIPLDYISKLSARLIDNKKVRELVCNRLQFLFVDEFQDVDKAQEKIFDQIRIEGRTIIYAVGDPEQFIMSFTYKGKIRPPFQKLPIYTFKAERIKKEINYRSYNPIVSFTNNFHSELQQKSTLGDNSFSRVVFIPSLELREIVIAYKKLCSEIIFDKEPLHFYLSRENNTFEPLATEFGLVYLPEHTHLKTVLDESTDLLCNFVGLTKRQISEKYKLEPLQIRKIGILLINAVKEGIVNNGDSLKQFIREDLKLEVIMNGFANGKEGEISVQKLVTIVNRNTAKSLNHQYSSIHKAKGLEAETVLVVAKYKSEFVQWITTDKNARATDNDDTCRLGYVAFTRAKILLCMGCLQPIDDNLQKMLVQLGVSILPIDPQLKQMKLI